MKITKKHLTSTAYHEAGHAVAAYWKRIAFKYVTIVPSKDKQTLGHLKQWGLPKWFQPDIESTPSINDRIEREIVILLAGKIAEKRHTGRYNHKWASSDTGIATDLALYIGGDGKGASLFLNWMWHCTEALVGIRWENIEMVAQSLLKKKKLTKKEVMEIIMVKRNIKSIYN